MAVKHEGLTTFIIVNITITPTRIVYKTYLQANKNLKYGKIKS